MEGDGLNQYLKRGLFGRPRIRQMTIRNLGMTLSRPSNPRPEVPFIESVDSVTQCVGLTAHSLVSRSLLNSGSTDRIVGDERSIERLVKLACVLAALTAAYRFYDNDQIDPDDILDNHTHTTIDRINEVPLVLSEQDTTEFDFTDHKGLKDAGP